MFDDLLQLEVHCLRSSVLELSIQFQHVGQRLGLLLKFLSQLLVLLVLDLLLLLDLLGPLNQLFSELLFAQDLFFLHLLFLGDQFQQPHLFIQIIPLRGVLMEHLLGQYISGPRLDILLHLLPVGVPIWVAE